MSDATIVLRDIAGDAATKAASKFNPSDDQLAQIDQPAEDNTWHEKPDFKNMKSNMQSKVPFSKRDAQNVADDANASAQQTSEGTTSDAAAQGADAAAKNTKSKLSDRMDEDQKQKLRDYRQRTNDYFKGKMPKERRDQIVLRLKKMVVEVQTHQDCKCSLSSGDT